jgi:hypothetical protein
MPQRRRLASMKVVPLDLGWGKKMATKGAPKSVKSTKGTASKRFTDEERAAMKERAQELKASARRGPRAG